LHPCNADRDNKPVAVDLRHNTIIAIFAELSTRGMRRTILLKRY
jgi:hypothetical protein